MKALISPNERRETGYRVAHVDQVEFDVAEPLFWISCANNVVTDLFWYDPQDKKIKPMPEPEIVDVNESQPTVQGAQNL